MDEVWTALTETDDLVMITDLRHINDRKYLMEAIESFRKIMTKDKNIDPNIVESNPLTTGKGTLDANIKEYEKIPADKRIFAELSDIIAEGSKELIILKNKLTRKEPIGQTEADDIKKEVDKNLKETYAKWASTNEQEPGLAFAMLQFFASEMSQDLLNRGKFLMRKNLEAIFKKAKKKWSREFNDAKTEFRITKLENKVRVDIW